MPEKLISQQMAFAGHIRDPKGNPAPDGVEDRRMQIYRDLFFNNINKFIAGSFPVLRKLYTDNDWKTLIRDFYREHRAHTPLFPELPKEFLRYLQESRENRPGDPPFILELAHYEWVELALSLDYQDLEDIAVEAEGDLLNGVPVLSPLAWPLSYNYPVHLIKPAFQPNEATGDITHILVYRNRKDMVKFMKLNEVTRLLLALMQEKPELTGQQLLELTAEKIGHPDPSVVVNNGTRLLADLQSRDVVLGTRPGTGLS